ncbi:MAG: glycosyltransferase [Firmicutes bacterium]|nr:glycosyltransferase [Bacillota bacterium]
MGIGIVSTYPPRRCGLATVAWHLRRALVAAGEPEVPVVAMVKDPGDIGTGPEILMPLRHHVKQDYLAAAERLNAAPVDAVILQHEFGIFGGPAGSLVHLLLAHLRKPVLTVFHTVLDDPPKLLATALRQVAAYSARVVALSHRDRNLLCSRHRLPADRVETISLGVPAPPPGNPEEWKARLGLSGRTVAMTFGLLGPGKGLETALEAVGRVAPSHPDLVYLVVGATHPDVRRLRGERYREYLQAEARNLGLGDQVRFVDRYLEEEELLGYLLATDIYITPYPQKGRGVSLTTLYAAGLGKAILTTPFDYAQELLGDGAGWMVPFGDPQAMAQALAALARDPLARAALGAAARARTRGLAWSDIGRRYLALARSVVHGPPQQP